MRHLLKSSPYRQNYPHGKLAAICLSILLVSASMWGQRNQTLQQDSQSTSVTGTTLTFTNDIGAISASFEYIITGTPGAVSIIASGCMRSGTCDTLETYTTVANSIRKPNTGGVAYDSFQFAITFSGGSSPAVKVNRLTTLARNGGVQTTGAVVAAHIATFIDSNHIQDGGAVPTGITNGAGNNVIPKSNGTNLVASSLTDDGAGNVVFASNASTNWNTAGGVGIEIIPFNTTPVIGGNAGTSALVFRVNNANRWNMDDAAPSAFYPTQDGTQNIGSAAARVATTFTQNVRGITAFLTSNYTNATTTFSNVTGLSFPVAASQNYKITCDLDYQTSATTADIKIQWTGPASPTAVTYDFKADLTATTSATDSVATAFSTSLAGTGTPTITTNLPLRTTLTLINGANAGTVQLQSAATGVGTITIVPGSCNVTQ